MILTRKKCRQNAKQIVQINVLLKVLDLLDFGTLNRNSFAANNINTCKSIALTLAT